VPYKQEISTLQ
jgi:enoyl reductase-like protein